MKNLQLTVSSLEKVFPSDKPKLRINSATVFRNETFHFQIACYSDVWRGYLKVKTDSDIKDKITVRAVELVPAQSARTFEGKDDGYYIKGHRNNELYPDLLRPFRDGVEILRAKMWSAYWVTVDASELLPAGEHKISVNFRCNDSAYNETSEFVLTVLDEELPKSDFTLTQWFHYDCICHRHNVEAFSDEFYAIFEKYLESAVRHGMNMLYTPLFTPALDTAVGRYRQTTQLVDVKLADDKYRFDFGKLGKFLDYVLVRGIDKIEFSHLATQHGGVYCPQIVADIGGKTERIFGWDDRSDSERYLTFLDALFENLSAFLDKNGLCDKVCFHISDEPTANATEIFSKIGGIVKKYIPNAKFIDALSHKDFYEKGIITNPFVSLYAYDGFPADWIYYCGEHRRCFFTNRLFAMPSQRNRIIGFQCYRNGVNGLLHWGFNFYNSYKSLALVDPYLITDGGVGGGCFDSGDCFIVYPTSNGVDESLRHEVLGDAFYDYRACLLAEKYYGKKYILDFLDKEGIKRGFSDYPRSAVKHLRIREKLNRLIYEKID